MPRTTPQPLALLFTEDDLGDDLYSCAATPCKPEPQHDDILAALLRAIASRRPPSPPPLSLPLHSPPPSPPTPPTPATPPSPPSPRTPIPLCTTPRKKSRSRRRSPLPPSPSRFCHVCARTQKSEKIFCANLHTDKKCRKAVCRPCFAEMKWDFDEAKLSGTWLCPHCRGICSSVPRARCHIYTKTNLKRKASRLLGAAACNEPC